MYTLKLYVRNQFGELTEKTKTFSTNDASKLADFWYSNQVRPKKKKKKATPVAKNQNNSKVMKSIAEYAEKIQAKRDNQNSENMKSKYQEEN